MSSANSTHHQIDHRVREFGTLCIRMRRGLIYRLDEFSGRPCYVIEDPESAKFCRIGTDEYALISLFDGETTIEEAIARTASSLGRNAFTEQEVAAICDWLIANDLAQTPASTQPNRLVETSRRKSRQRWRSRLNPLFLRVPLFNPDRLLESLLPWTHWLISWPAAVLWCVLVICGASQAWAHWDQFMTSSIGVLAPSNWLALGLAWAGLKIVHELFHGLVCKKYGGHVPECGIVLILFAPAAYMDATSSWRFSSKWQRILTSAAGMYAELACASLAVIAWSFCDSPSAQQFAYNIAIAAGVNTVLFNANPLMRFDGYYILADWLEIPNLSTWGQRYVGYLFRRWYLGLEVRPLELPRKQAAFIKIYGLAAGWWRIIVSVSILLAAHALIPGVGLVLAAISAVIWFGAPVVSMARATFVEATTSKPKPLRVSLATASCVLAVAALFTWVPWPGIVRAPAIVQAVDRTAVYAETSGFVQEIVVKNGQKVEQGQVLLRLVNEEAKHQLSDLLIQLQLANLQRSSLLRTNQVAAAQVQLGSIRTLEKKLNDKRRQIEGLTVRSPQQGYVVRRDLESLVDRFARRGDYLMEILGKESEISVSISQDDIQHFHRHAGRPLLARVEGHDTRITGRLIDVQPQASIRVTHPVLTAAVDGPIAVRPIRDPRESNGEPDLEFLSPRFTGIVSVRDSADISAFRGQRATVWFFSSHESVGQFLFRNVRNWVEARIHAGNDRHLAHLD